MKKSGIQAIRLWHSETLKIVNALDGAYGVICPCNNTAANVLFSLTVALVGKFGELGAMLGEERRRGVDQDLMSILSDEEDEDDEILKETPTVRLVR